MPIVSNRVFTADGYFYNVSAVLDSQLRLNETAYKNYGMLIDEEIVISSNLTLSNDFLGEVRMTAVLAFSYAISFSAIAAVIAHTILYHGKLIIFNENKYYL